MTIKEEMNKPVFSVITVTLNHLNGLKNTLNSLKQQTCTSYEWIVIDGASSDGTQDYLKTTNANWISEKDNGIYDAMNKGINRAQGDYLIFMNAGDCFTDEATLNIIEKTTQETPAPDFIYGDASETIDNKTTLKRSRHHTKINQGMFTHHQAMIYRRTMLENQQYSMSYPIAADYDLTLRVLKETSNIFYVPQSICLFESGGISQQQALQGRKEQFLIRQKERIGFLKNSAVFIAQSFLYALRKTVPFLYWRLKRY